MKKKLKWYLTPSNRLYFIVMAVFALVTIFFGRNNLILGLAEVAVLAALFIYTRLSNRERSREALEYIASVTANLDPAAGNLLQSFPLPMAVFSLEENEIIYTNESFLEASGEREHSFSIRISDVVPDFNARWLMEGKNEYPGLVALGDRKYRVFGNLTRNGSASGLKNYAATTYWVDETEYAQISEEFESSRLIFGVILIDNYDDFLNGLSDKDKSAVLADIDDKVTTWASGRGGYLSKYDRDRYVYLFEARYYPQVTETLYAILDSVRALTSTNGMHPTLSIGLGRDGKTIEENQKFASLSIDMALSRGGDQAVVKNRFNFEFYGGKTAQTEKRTKVKSRVMSGSLSELMRDASNILVMGHKHSDLDSIGAAVGVCCAARALGRTAKIVVEREDAMCLNLIERMETLPEYADAFISPQDAMLMANGSTLLVIVDTNRPEQVESESLLLSCNSIALIDHHRRASEYIQNAALSFHEPYASSACELVTELLEYIVDPSGILRFEAEALLSGIVLDTKNFTLRTGGRTFDAAAFLRRAGADTTEVKTLLQTDMNSAMARYALIQRAKIYKKGIAVAAADTVQSRIIAAQAADELLNIAGVNASFVVFQADNSVDISARSIGDVNVQLIVEKLGGGGTKATAGAQLQGAEIRDVVRRLLAAIDEYLAENE